MRDHYELLVDGLPIPWRNEDARLLLARYGIEERAVAGCEVSQSLEDYVEGYNTMSNVAIKLRFGQDVFRKTNQDAVKHWRLAQVKR